MQCQFHFVDKLERVVENKIEYFCLECFVEKSYRIEAENYDAKLKEIKIENRKNRRNYFIYTIILGLLLWTSWNNEWNGLIIFFLCFATFGTFSVFIGSFEKQLPFTTYDNFRKEQLRTIEQVESEVTHFKQRLKKKYQKLNSNIDVIDQLSGIDFEIYVANLLRNLGYKDVKLTKATGDNGVDVLAIDKQGKKVAIQCKRMKNKVSNSAVQQVYTGKDAYKCHKAMVITNSFLTEPAYKLAKQLNVTVWSRKTLIEKASSVYSDISWEEFLTQYYVQEIEEKEFSNEGKMSGIKNVQFYGLKVGLKTKG
ncbi:restriction endonuclease [Bacillus sp. AFS017336]|uniref:restriction endonuclease n=1 Tax=Bacillus sp. AFS017336 TaxID=2033489 RepID=UPI000BF1B8FD|nr:restriction endonuclease [Bacillus sp. AFS017336]PEL13027.1 hypothetical protein CN601_05940 [Bacillus sp. AFS017336]